MAKKKIVRAEDITEKDILSLYEELLPLLYVNPKGINPIDKLNKYLLRFVWYDSYHYVMEETETPLSYEKQHALFYQWGEFGNRKTSSGIDMVPVKNSDPEKGFDELVEHNFKSALERLSETYPGYGGYHYFRIRSANHPKVVVGFFKNKDRKEDSSFTEDNTQILEIFAPHIFLLIRTILNPAFQTPTFKYFNAYTEICSKIERECALSTMESKFLTEILFGFSNEEMAKRNFVSPATVKKHLRNIFKKTGTKNRIDFIGKFFTSPTRVQL